jgi:PBP1b-binding outer membrane lipoprotein LpoB
MSRIALALALAGLLVGCSSLNDKFGEITQDKKPSTFSNTAPP